MRHLTRKIDKEREREGGRGRERGKEHHNVISHRIISRNRRSIRSIWEHVIRNRSLRHFVTTSMWLAVSISFAAGTTFIPDNFVTPALKKHGLDPTDMKNFDRDHVERSLSAPTIPRMVFSNFNLDLTESALLRVLSDLFSSVDSGDLTTRPPHVTALTVDHDMREKG